MLINKKLAGKETATLFGQIKFDLKGVAQELTEEQEKVFQNVKGFVYKESKKLKEDLKEPSKEIEALESMTISALKEFASKKKITIPSTLTKKDDIKEKIKDAIENKGA